MTSAASDHIDGILAQWRRQRPDLDVAPLGLLGRLFRTAQLADAALGESLAGVYKLQPGWFDLLAALRRSGAPFELRPTQLMQATMLSSGGMTKRLDRLAEAGLVERRPDPADRRGTLVRLTRRGQTTIDKAVETHVANEDRLLRALSVADRDTLDQLLRRLLADLERPAPDRRHAAPARRRHSISPGRAETGGAGDAPGDRARTRHRRGVGMPLTDFPRAEGVDALEGPR